MKQFTAYYSHLTLQQVRNNFLHKIYIRPHQIHIKFLKILKKNIGGGFKKKIALFSDFCNK